VAEPPCFAPFGGLRLAVCLNGAWDSLPSAVGWVLWTVGSLLHLHGASGDTRPLGTLNS
jgi:hypothetical protein